MPAFSYFQSAATPAGFFDALFGGVFMVKGVPLAGQLVLLLCLPLMVLTAALVTQSPTPTARRWNGILGVVYFVTAAFFLMIPWDEMFVHLRHSRHFGEGHGFSFNRLEKIEGSADFLVYTTLGFLSGLGLPLEELNYLQGIVCGLWIAWTGSKIIEAYCGAKWRSAAWTFLCVFPPLLYNSASGFGTTAFVGALLSAIRALFFAKKPNLVVAAVFLFLIPLIRYEGVIFAVALAGAFILWKPVQRAWFLLAVPLTSFALMGALRLFFFGTLLPIPVAYKNTGFHAFYTAVGLRNLLADLVACDGWLALLTLAAILAITARRLPTSTLKLLQTSWSRSPWLPSIAAMSVSVVPYYISGGDWFPSYWGRYLLPWTLVVVLAAFALLISRWKKGVDKDSLWLAGGVALCGIFLSLWPISSRWKFIDHVFSHRRTLAKIHEPTIGRGHYRIQHLAQLGTHLRETTPENFRIASSEVATIMYFANRETIDLLGVASPEIAKNPVREPPPIFRRFPDKSELPHLIFKRNVPPILERRRPEILYTFDFMWRDMMPDLPLQEASREDLIRALQRWELKLGGLIDALYGGLKHLSEIGYHPIIVRGGDQFICLYWVSNEAFESHVKRLQDAGFSKSDWGVEPVWQP